MAQRATSLGPKPSLFVLVCFFVLFIVLSFIAFRRRNLFLPPKRAFLLTLQCLPLFLPSFLLNFPFSLSLSLSLSCSFLSSLLPCFCLFVYLRRLCLVSLLLFHEKNNIKTLNYKVFFLQSFCFLVTCLICLSNAFICVFT